MFFGALAFSSFVRTAWLPLFLFGGLYVYQSVKQDQRRVLLSILLIGALTIWIADNEVVIDRLLNRNKFSEDQGLESLGSNRSFLWLTNLGIVANLNFVDLLWGVGTEGAFERMTTSIGFAKVSHNLLIDVLVREGVVGVTLYVLALRELLILLRRSGNFFGSVSFGSIFLSWLLFQGTSFHLFDVLTAICAAQIIQE